MNKMYNKKTKQITKKLADSLEQSDNSSDLLTESIYKESLILVFSLVIMLLAAKLIVWSAESIADIYGLKESIIGITVIALGSSLPELSSSIVAMRKNHASLVLGNIIGSNTMNTLLVIGSAVFIAPAGTEITSIVRNDMVISLALAIFLFCLVFLTNLIYSQNSDKNYGHPKTIQLIGGFLVVFYLCYIAYTGMGMLA